MKTDLSSVAPAALSALLLALASPRVALADANQMPRLLWDPAEPGAAELIRVGGNAEGQVDIAPDATGVNVTLRPGFARWPGIVIVPAGGKPSWDISIYGHVEAKVTNLGTDPIALTFRVDNASIPGQNPWNGEVVRLAAGQSTRASVFFGRSWYFQPGYPLDASAVVRVQLYGGDLKSDVRFRVEDLKAAGWQGEKPGQENPDQARVKPERGVILSPSLPDAAKRAAFVADGGAKGSWSADARGVRIDFPAGAAPGAKAVVKPPRGWWDLSDSLRAIVRVRNAGASPVRPRFRLDSVYGSTDEFSPAAPIAPGATVDVEMPFAPKVPFTVAEDPKQSDPEYGGSFDRIPGTGTAFRNHKVGGLVVLPEPGGAAQSVEVTGLLANDPPYTRPAWLGFRPPVDGEWAKTLDEEFDGDELDDRIFGVRWYNWWDKRQHFSAGNVFLRDGRLVLRAERKRGHHDDDPAQVATDYATGWVTTFGKWSQRYGYFEFRAKMPTAACLWPAVWMIPDRGLEAYPRGLPKLDWEEFKGRTDVANGGMEIDILEGQTIWGPHRFNSAFHWDGYGKTHKKIGSSAFYVPTDPEGFLTIGMLWLPGSITLYGNGEPFLVWNGSRVSSVPSCFHIQNTFGGWETDPLDAAELPADFEIDYIRVWQRKDLASPLDGQKPNLGGLDNREPSAYPEFAK